MTVRTTAVGCVLKLVFLERPSSSILQFNFSSFTAQSLKYLNASKFLIQQLLNSNHPRLCISLGFFIKFNYISFFVRTPRFTVHQRQRQSSTQRDVKDGDANYSQIGLVVIAVDCQPWLYFNLGYPLLPTCQTSRKLGKLLCRIDWSMVACEVADR